MTISFSSGRQGRKFQSISSAVPRHKVEQLENRRLLAGRASEAINAFAFDVYDNLQREQGNLFFSPLSLSTALGMTYAGARGNTATQLENVTHFGSTPGIHEAFRSLYESYVPFITSVGGGPRMRFANAFWRDDQFSLNQEYATLVQDNYRATVQAVDFANPSQAESTINQWVANHTDQLIPQLVKDLSSDTAFVLTNALAYKASWADAFNASLTSTAPFTRKDGTTINVPMMSQSEFASAHFKVQRIGDFVVADMPLAGGTNQADMSFVVAQPVSADSPDVMTRDVYAQLIPLLQQPRTDGYSFQYRLTLPKFEMSTTTNLESLVAGLGATDAFEPGVADFSGMTPEAPWLSLIKQKAALSVGEKGLYAAAATSIQGELCFAAGTPVLTPDGVRAIEEIQVGDLVMSRDQFNIEGEVRARPVEKLKRGNAEVIELVIGGQVICTTAPHPFFVRARGWTAAEDLIPGDLLATNGEDWVALQSRRATGEIVPVFNFDVGHDHTYFVGGSPGIWVHNDYDDWIMLNRPFHFFITDNTTSTILFMGRLRDPSQLTNEVTPTVVPEPDAAVLLGVAVIVASSHDWRRRAKSESSHPKKGSP
jgi:serpin B